MASFVADSQRGLNHKEHQFSPWPGRWPVMAAHREDRRRHQLDPWKSEKTEPRNTRTSRKEQEERLHHRVSSPDRIPAPRTFLARSLAGPASLRFPPSCVSCPSWFSLLPLHRLSVEFPSVWSVPSVVPSPRNWLCSRRPSPPKDTNIRIGKGLMSLSNWVTRIPVAGSRRGGTRRGCGVARASTASRGGRRRRRGGGNSPTHFSPSSGTTFRKGDRGAHRGEGSPFFDVREMRFGPAAQGFTSCSTSSTGGPARSRSTPRGRSTTHVDRGRETTRSRGGGAHSGRVRGPGRP